MFNILLHLFFLMYLELSCFLVHTFVLMRHCFVEHRTDLTISTHRTFWKLHFTWNYWKEKKHIWIKKQGFACIFVLNEKVISKSDYWLDYIIIVTMLHGSEILYGLFPLNGATFVSQMHFWVEQQSWACGLVDILHQW